MSSNIKSFEVHCLIATTGTTIPCERVDGPFLVNKLLINDVDQQSGEQIYSSTIVD